MQPSSSGSLNEVQFAAEVIWRKLCWKLAMIVASDSHRKRRQVGLVSLRRQVGLVSLMLDTHGNKQPFTGPQTLRNVKMVGTFHV